MLKKRVFRKLRTNRPKARNASRMNAEALYDLICAHPGIYHRDLARLAGKSGNIQSNLATLDAHGFLVYEDDAGQLFPFTE
jgi:hypothetical protein